MLNERYLILYNDLIFISQNEFLKSVGVFAMMAAKCYHRIFAFQ
jgi:hypothetical protein